MSKGLKIDFLFVPFPQEIWREGVDLTEAEFKLLGYLLYHQVRFGRALIPMTDDEMLNGRKAVDGSRVDGGCGIKGRNTFKTAREKLGEREWVECEVIGGIPNYRVLLSTTPFSAEVEPLDETTAVEAGTVTVQNGQSGVRNGQRKCPKQTPEVSKMDTPNKEERTNKELNKKTDVFALPDWIPAEPWNEWFDWRKRKGYPNTARVMRSCVRDLDEYRGRGHPPEKILELAMVRGWRGLFEPRGNDGKADKFRDSLAAIDKL